MKILDAGLEFSVKIVPKHKKNSDLGSKSTSYGPEILLEQQDAVILELGEEVTLMDWGNAFVKAIKKDGAKVTSVELSLHLEGDFKKTKKKLTWLCRGKSDNLVPLHLLDYDYLITKKKLEEDDTFENCVNKATEFKVEAIGDSNLRSIKKGEIIQLERKGFYICDKEYSASSPAVHLILIPDGKAESVALKATPTDTAKTISAAPQAEKSAKQAKVPKAANSDPKKAEMYEMSSVYQEFDANDSMGKSSSMYAVESFYPKVAKSAKVPKGEQNQVKPATKEAKKVKTTDSGVPQAEGTDFLLMMANLTCAIFI